MMEASKDGSHAHAQRFARQSVPPVPAETGMTVALSPRVA
jgi:hypothetical protein